MRAISRDRLIAQLRVQIDGSAREDVYPVALAAL